MGIQWGGSSNVIIEIPPISHEAMSLLYMVIPIGETVRIVYTSNNVYDRSRYILRSITSHSHATDV